MEYNINLYSKNNDLFSFSIQYTDRQYDMYVYLLENNSHTHYIKFGNQLQVQLYGAFNVNYLSFSIFMNDNAKLGLGTIAMDALISFIQMLNQSQNRFKYLVGSIDIGTKDYWYDAINFYLQYKNDYIISRQLFSGNDLVPTADDFIKREIKGKIIFNFFD